MTRPLTIQALCLSALLTACVPATPDEASTAALASHAADQVDGGFAPCPTSGDGGIVAPAACWTFTAAAAGASTAGDNATVDEYALEPAGSTRQGKLVLLLNASQSQPSEFIADPDTNLYNTLAGQGFHVLGLAYRSSNMIAAMCNTSACFGPTRETIVTGAYVTGASSKVSDMREDEGIVQRLKAALQYLDAHHPASGWAQFLGTPGGTLSESIAWNKVIASGHSQGGGHAAYLDKLYDVPRVVQLSSTCDNINGLPVEWTDASSSWITSPNAIFVGFAVSTGFNANGVPVSGDTACPYHAAVWQNMALATANMHDNATTCPGVTAHGATVACTANATEWANLYQ